MSPRPWTECLCAAEGLLSKVFFFCTRSLSRSLSRARALARSLRGHGLRPHLAHTTNSCIFGTHQWARAYQKDQTVEPSQTAAAYRWGQSVGHTSGPGRGIGRRSVRRGSSSRKRRGLARGLGAAKQQRLVLLGHLFFGCVGYRPGHEAAGTRQRARDSGHEWARESAKKENERRC